MQAQGENSDKINEALENYRKNKGGSTAPTNDTSGPTKAPLDPIDAAINAALNSPNAEKRLEGQVAKALKDAGFKVTDFNTQIGPNGSVGEIDVATDKAIIEVTNQSKDKLKQVDKYLTNKGMNPDGKHVILYAPNYEQRPERNIVAAGSEVIRSIPDLLKRMHDLSGN